MASAAVMIKFIAEKDSSIDAIKTEMENLFSQVGSNTAIQDLMKTIATSSDQAAATLARVSSQMEQLSQGVVQSTRDAAAGNQAAAQQASNYSNQLVALNTSLAAFATNNRTIVDSNQQLQQQVIELSQDIQILKQRIDEAGASAQQTAGQVGQNLQSSLSQVGQTAGIAMTAAGASILGLAGAAVSTAGSFQQMQLRLESVTGSAEQARKLFAQAVEQAKSTPFEVKGLVEATVTLEAYHQNAEKTLPQVTALASAMGRGIEETSLVIGKAMSGSEQGFRSLRDEYGVTTVELAKFGAQVNSMGQMLLHTPEQIASAREALRSLIETRFGDAVARQMDGFAGAMTNAKDAMTNTAASFGATLLPAVNGALHGFAGFVDKLNELPTPLKALVSYSAVAGGGLLAMGGAATLGVVGLVALNAQLALLQTRLAAAGVEAVGLRSVVSFLPGAFAQATAGATALGEGLAAIPALAGGAVLPILATGAALAGLAAVWESHEKALQTALQESSRKAVEASRDFRHYLDTLNEAGKATNTYVKILGDAKTETAAIGDALAHLSGEQLAEAFTQAGESVDTLTTKLDKVRAGSQDLRDKIAAVQAALDEWKSGGVGTSFIYEQLERVGIKMAYTEINAESLGSQLKALKTQFQEVGETETLLQGGLDKFREYKETLTGVVDSAGKLKDYLKFTDRLKDAESMRQALKAIGDQLERNAKIQGLGGSEAQLTGNLSDPKTSPLLKAATEAQLGLMEQRDKLNKAIEQKAIEAAEREHRVWKLSHDETLADQQRFIDQELALVEKGSEKELQLLERKAENQKKMRSQELQEVRDHLKNLYEDAKGRIEERTSDGGGAKEAVAGYDGAIKALDKWKAAHSAAMAGASAEAERLREQFHHLYSEATTARDKEAAKVPKEAMEALKAQIADSGKDAVTASAKLLETNKAIALVQQAQAGHLVRQADAEKYLTELQHKRAEEQKSVLTENMSKLKTQIAEAGENAVSAEAKLLVVNQSIASVQAQQKKHLVDQQDAAKELASLEHQRASLAHQVAQEYQHQQAELAKMKLQGQDKTIESIQARKEGGETKINGRDVSKVLEDAYKQRFQQTLNAAAVQKQLELDAAGDSAQKRGFIEQQYTEKVKQLAQDETNRRLRELNQQESDLKASLEKQQQMREGSAQKGIHGSSLDISALPNIGDHWNETALGDLDANSDLQKFRNSEAQRTQLEKLRDSHQSNWDRATQAVQGDMQRQRSGILGQAQGAGASAGAPTVNQNITNNISVPGAGADVDRMATQLGQAIGQRALHDARVINQVIDSSAPEMAKRQWGVPVITGD